MHARVVIMEMLPIDVKEAVRMVRGSGRSPRTSPKEAQESAPDVGESTL